MRECCKGDDATQWGNGKFDPLPLPNPLTERCVRDYVPDIYPHAKFDHDPSRGFFSPYARNCASKMFTRLLFSPGSSNGPQPRPLNRFSRVIRQTTLFRARLCLFGVRKQKFNIYTRNSRKTAIFGPAFDGTLENFRPKSALQWGAPM